MASKVEGIVIEIGGETTKLERALKNVQEKGKDLNKQLKDVNTSLKFNPGNADLIAQKQRILAESVGNTKKKLETLKAAQEKANEALKRSEIGQDAYDELSREIIKTENKLKSFEKQLNKVNTGALEMGEKFKKTGAKLESAGNKMKLFSAAAGAASIALLKMGADFEESIAKVSTIADTTEVPINVLKKQIMALSNQSGIEAKENISIVRRLRAAVISVSPGKRIISS